jgi:hypothetical protein
MKGGNKTNNRPTHIKNLHINIELGMKGRFDELYNLDLVT